MTRAHTFKLAVSILLALLVVGLGGWSVHRKVQSFQPLGFTAVASGAGFQVETVEDAGTGLRPGDQIFLIQGGEVTGWVALKQQLRERAESRLTVLRGPELAPELITILYARPALDVDVPYLILSLIGVVYLLIGLYTLLRQGSRQGFLFYLWCLTSAAFYLLTPVPPEDRIYRALYLGDELARIFLPALTLHLFLMFPAPLRTARWSERRIPFLYIPAAALLALQLDLALANGRWIFGRPTAERLLALDRFEMLHFVALAVVAIAVLAWRLRHGRGWEQQRQMQWVAFGVGVGYLPFLVLYGFPAILGLRGPEPLTAVSVLPLALVPLTFAYAILRYKLWDIEVIVRDTISMTLTLLLGIIGFSLVNLAISRGVPSDLMLARNFLLFVSGLIIAGLLVPTRTTISSALERLQYRGTFGKRRALSDLGRELLHERDLARLSSALLQEIELAVNLERTNLYLVQDGWLSAVRPEEDLPERIPLDAVGEEIWSKDFVRIAGTALPGETLPPEQRLFIAGYRYAFPLTVRGRGVGLVLAGFKQEQAPLNSDDTFLIRHLLNQAALAIENAQLLGQLSFQLEEVRSLQRYTEGIFESSPAGIAVLDEERRIVSANAAFARLAGMERGDLAGRRLAEVLPVSALPESGQGPIEVSFCDPSGQERYLQISLALFEGVPHGGGERLRVLVVHDVSERVAMENALKEKDRLAALGVLAAGVAHEVNTPITGISSYAQMLLSDTAESDPHYEILKKVERQTFRAARIVNNLLEFARNRQKERKPVEVAPILRECVDLLGERLEKRRVELRWELGEEPAVVMGCDGELQQVFTNLLLNAFDAVAGAPGAAPCDRPPGRITIALQTDDSRVRVKIQDNGPGIPPEKLEAIFQPFYSTKLNRGGTGLGLSISSDIVRRHGGELRAASKPDEGACFIVELPRYGESQAQA